MPPTKGRQRREFRLGGRVLQVSLRSREVFGQPALLLGKRGLVFHFLRLTCRSPSVFFFSAADGMEWQTVPFSRRFRRSRRGPSPSCLCAQYMRTAHCQMFSVGQGTLTLALRAHDEDEQEEGDGGEEARFLDAAGGGAADADGEVRRGRRPGCDRAGSCCLL